MTRESGQWLRPRWPQCRKEVTRFGYNLREIQGPALRLDLRNGGRAGS